MFKKAMAVTLLLVTALCLTACPGGTGSPSVEEIIEKAVQAMEDIKTYQFEMDMSMDMASEAGGETYEETIEMNYDGTFDIENGEMMLDMYASVAMFAEGMEMSGAIYLIDGVAYVMTEDPELGPVWEKVEMPGEYWEELSQLEPQMEMLQAVQAEVIGSEKIRGVDCYVLNFTPDIGQLLQLAMEQSLLSEEEMALLDMDEQIELYQDVFKDYSIKQWVAKDTYLIARAEMNIAMELTSEALGYTDGEGVATMDMTMDLLIYDYNQPVSIVLPEGAEEAVEAGVSQGIVDEANTEAFDVDMAVLEAMIDNDIYELTAGGTVGPGYASSVFAADGVTELDVAPYLYSYLEATYTLDEYGWVIAAVAEPGGRWDGLTYTPEDGWVE